MRVFMMGISCDQIPDWLFQRIAWLLLSSIHGCNQRAATSANTRKRAQISTNERKLKMCVFQNSRVVQEPRWRPAECNISWTHFQDINWTTTGQWWQSWWNPRNVSARASGSIHAHVHDWDGWGLKDWFVALFFGGIANEHFFHKRTFISSSVYLCSFEAVGIYIYNRKIWPYTVKYLLNSYWTLSLK